MRDLFIDAFPKCAPRNCHHTRNDEEIKMTDFEGSHCNFIDEGDECFVIHNPNKKDIHILFIDKCIFVDADPWKKCECAAYDDKKICFIEFKKTVKNKVDYVSSAVDQLVSAIKKIKEKIDFKGYEIESYIAFADYPVVPAVLTTNQIAEAKLTFECNSAYYEGNQITF